MEFSEFLENDLKKVEEKIKELIPKEEKDVYGMLEEYIFRGGKRIRPALLMLSFRSLGGKNFDLAFKAAAIVELFHNFTLIHDDIEDDSQFRRGKPTLHKIFGVPIALNSGDALYTIVWRELASFSLVNKYDVVVALGNSFKEVVEGQGIELQLIRDNNFSVTEEEYFKIIKKKTAALLGASCEVGAILADSDKKTREKFKEFGELLGLAFQIRDDALNLVGDFDKYKKEIGGDITEGKRTLMVIHSLAHLKEKEKDELLKILSSKTRSKAKIKRAISLIKSTNSIEYALSKAKEFKERADRLLDDVPNSEAKSELLKISSYILSREN